MESRYREEGLASSPQVPHDHGGDGVHYPTFDRTKQAEAANFVCLICGEPEVRKTMSTRPLRRTSTTLLALGTLIGTLCLGGCGARTDDDAPSTEGFDAAAQPVAPIDERFASPGALVRHAKSILDAPDCNMRQFYNLFRWETPAQKTWERYIFFVAIPHGNLKRELTKRFPSQPWPGGVPIYFFEMRIPDDKITASDDQRAQAVFRERNGPPQVLHLVKSDGRWWISGYTLEHASSVDKLNKIATDSGQSLEALLIAAGREHQGVQDLTQRVRNGEIKTMEQFWRAAKDQFGEP